MTVKRTEAQKEAEKRWQAQNPSSTLRLPESAYNQLKQAAKDTNQSYHGLLKQIVMDWLEKENR